MATTLRELGPLTRFYQKHIRTVRVNDAEDVLQDLYVKLLDKGFESYDSDKPFKSWFWRVAYHHMLDQMKKAKLRFAIPIKDGLLAPGLNPEDRAILNEEHQRLLAALSTLPQDQKQIIEWRMSGMSWEQIRVEKGIDPADKNKMQRDVYQPYYRGMRTLKTMLT